MICAFCGEPFRPEEEPVIIDEIIISRKVYEGKERSQSIITGLRAHRECVADLEANVRAAEAETCDALEEGRKKRMGS